MTHSEGKPADGEKGTGMIRCDRVIVERSGQMVIDRLSLSLGAGETLAVIGRSGAG